MPTSTTTPPKILITGASGHYGRLTTDQLLAHGVPPSSLLLLTRDPSKLSAYASQGLAIRRGSFDDDVATLAAAFAGADVLLLISTSRAGQRLPQHQAAVDAAAAAGVAHIVYTSFVGADAGRAAGGKDEATALVVREHAATEGMLRRSGCAWTALRDSQYADAMAGVVAPVALKEGVVRCNAGEGRIAFVSREDCVAAAVAVLREPERHRNRVYDITGPELLSWRDAAGLIGEVVGRGRDGVGYEPLSDEEQLAVFDAMGIPREPIDDYVVNGYPWNSSDMVSFGKATRLGEMEVISDHVELLTGKKPKSLRQVLEETLLQDGK